MRKVELQGEAFTKHIERSGTGYHLKGYDALQGGRIDQQHASLVVDDDAVARGVDEGTLIVDTRLRDALRTLRRDAGPRSFALPVRARRVARASSAERRRRRGVRGRGRRPSRGLRRSRAEAARRAGAASALARGAMTQVVGLVLVRNEDVFVEQAIRNVADFCDRIHVVDHVSNDRTWPIVRSLAKELDHVDARRTRNATVAKKLLEPYTGTDTWAFGVDGDELYDPEGLARFRRDLEDGAHADVFRIKAHVLNCDRLDEQAGTASGWLAPPSRPVTKLFNFAARRVVVGQSRAVSGWGRRLQPGLSLGVPARPRGRHDLGRRPAAVPSRLLPQTVEPRPGRWWPRTAEPGRVSPVRPRPDRVFEATRATSTAPAPDPGATAPGQELEARVVCARGKSHGRRDVVPRYTLVDAAR